VETVTEYILLAISFVWFLLESIPLAVWGMIIFAWFLYMQSAAEVDQRHQDYLRNMGIDEATYKQQQKEKDRDWALAREQEEWSRRSAQACERARQKYQAGQN